MNSKKVVLIGVIALVVFGCVIAAGCTTTEELTADPIVGTWNVDMPQVSDLLSGLTATLVGNKTIGDGIVDSLSSIRKIAFDMNADGTGKMNFYFQGELLDSTDVSWIKKDETKYLIDFIGDRMEFDLNQGLMILSDESGLFQLTKVA